MIVSYRLCIKSESVKDDEPLTVSIFKKNLNSIEFNTNSTHQNIDSKNSSSSRTLLHQINLDDENIRNICEFKMKIKKLNQEYFMDEEQITSNVFIMETKPNSINLYLNSSSKVESAIVLINCFYKEFILHRSVLNLERDNF